MRTDVTPARGPARAGLALAALLFGAAPPAGADQAAEGAPPNLRWVDTYEEALEAASRDGHLVLVDFYTDWCGWCKKLDRDVFAKESFQQAASGVVGVKVNAERHRALARQYGATSYPRLFFLDSDGGVLEQIRGYLSLQDFTAKVQAIKNGDSEYSRLQAAASDPQNLQALRRFARFLSDTHRADQGIEYWQQTRDLVLQRVFQNPNSQGLLTYHREALLELGKGYRAVGLKDVARQHFDEVIASYPDTPHAAESMLILAEMHVEEENAPAARQLLERIVQEIPMSPAARQAAARLRMMPAPTQ